MLGIKPGIVKINGVKTVDYWDKSKAMINKHAKFIESLENYPKEDIKPEIIHKITPYLQDPAFVPEKIAKASEAAEGICKWVIAICKFDMVYKEITPKRIALAQAE